MNDSSNLRVGVIGLGMGRHHVSSFSNHPNAEVVAIHASAKSNQPVYLNG